LKEQWIGKGAMQSLKTLLDVSFPEYVYINGTFLQSLKEDRQRCMKMMNVSEKDMIKFSKQRTSNELNPEKEGINKKMTEEFLRYDAVIEQAKEKLQD
jgi:CRISPR/Cas system CSM-associated protein Csm5 (group 7 of RAMP superfamily)